ncbi:MAG TPA: TetR/AcrR family transcriptional regulator [Bacteroidales bacterium]|nr:TetR/AcrR family transcriptional regulator [Bacteroidales bacterium]
MKDTKDIILKTAYDMFLYSNYEAVTIRNIIKATGLTKGAIYHYYESKEELFKAVVDKYMLENLEDSDVTYDKLKDIIQHTIDTIKGKTNGMLIESGSSQIILPINYISLMVSAYRYYPDYEKIGRTFFKRKMGKWEQTIKTAIEKGEIRQDTDIRATVATFMQVSTGIVANMMMGGSITYALNMLERQFWELYKNIKK